MNLKKLPEHLQPLMEDLAEDLTLKEREELAAAIYEYTVLIPAPAPRP